MGILVGTAVGGRLASLDALALVYQASWIVQLVLVLLALLSIFSWAIILFKALELRRAQQDSESFLQVYHERSMEEAYEAARDLDRSPLAAVFLSTYGELRRAARASGRSFAVTESQVEALRRHVGWAGSREGLRLERGFAFLATTGSAAPHHQCVSGHRPRGLREPRGGGAGHRGGAHRDGGGSVRRDPGHDLLQSLRG
jgi:hypothetical protein